MTAVDFAAERNITVDRVRTALREKFPNEKFDRHASLRGDHISALNGIGGRRRKLTAKSLDTEIGEYVAIAANRPLVSDSLLSGSGSKEISAGRTETQITRRRQVVRSSAITFAGLRRFFLNGLIGGIVLGHAALIWYDCAQLWATPGIIGGGMAFLIVLATVLVSTDTGKTFTQQAGLWTVLLIDAGAWFVHYPTFIRFASIGALETGILCGFICLFSFLALVLFQTYRNE